MIKMWRKANNICQYCNRRIPRAIEEFHFCPGNVDYEHTMITVVSLGIFFLVTGVFCVFL